MKHYEEQARPVAVVNVWNDRVKSVPRGFSVDRPWYARGLELLRGIEIGGEALDVGCGVGEFLGLLNAQGIHAVGCDGNEEQVRCVRSLGFQAEVVDLEGRLPYPDERFELVTCLEVIEHVARAERLLEEIARILVPNAYLLLSTPNFAFWRQRLRHLRGLGPYGEGTHLRFFTPRTLQHALVEAGLSLERRGSFGPQTGFNLCRRILGLNDKHSRIPSAFEKLMAFDLLYLARKRQRPRA